MASERSAHLREARQLVLHDGPGLLGQHHLAAVSALRKGLRRLHPRSHIAGWDAGRAVPLEVGHAHAAWQAAVS